MATSSISRRDFIRRVAALTGGIAAASVIGAGCTPRETPAPTAAPPPAEATAAPAQATAAPAQATFAPVEPTAVPTAPVKAEQKITLRVQVEGGVLGVQMGELCEKWNANNPNIQAVVEEVVYSEMAMKTELGYATGDLQDSLFAFTRWHHLGAYKGWYLALDDLLEAGVVPDFDDYYPVGIEAQKFEGKIYGLLDSVYTSPTNCIIWNRNLFEEAGVEPPSPDMNLWDLHELALKVANPDKGIFGLQMWTQTPGRLNAIVRSWGKPEYGVNGDTSSWLVSPDGKTYRFIDNPGVKAFVEDWLRPLLDARAHPTDADEVDEGLFVAGRLAMYQGTHGHSQRFKNSIGDKWEFHTQDAMLVPVGPDGRRGTSFECHNRCVYGKTKYPEETLRLNAFVTGYEAGLVSLGMTGSRSGRKSVMSDPQWHDEYPIYMKVHELLESGTLEPYPMPWNLRDVEASDIHANVYGPLRQGLVTWEEQAPIMQKDMQDLFDQDRP